MNAKLWLDRRSVKKNGCCPVKVAVSWKSKTVLFQTGVDVNPDAWDGAKMKKGVGKDTVNDRLNVRLHEVTVAVNQVLAAVEPVDAKDFKARVMRVKAARTLENTEKTGKGVGGANSYADALVLGGGEALRSMGGDGLIDYYCKIRAEKQGRTFDIYGDALRWIRLYCGSRAELMTLSEINRTWIEGLNVTMRDGGCKSKDTRSMYLRCLKHVMTRAYDDELVSRNPFKKYVIEQEPIRNDEYLELDELRRFLTWEVQPYQRKYRDFWWLSFLLVGINPSDLLDLMPNDIRNGVLTYQRNKTGKWYSVRVEPEAMEIINRYRGKKKLLSWGERRVPKRFADKANKELKRIGTWKRKKAKKTMTMQLDKPLFPDITLYWARYTWAQMTDEIGDNFRIVEEGLGHALKETDRYVRSRQKRVWDMNRKVIDEVLQLNKQ